MFAVLAFNSNLEVVIFGPYKTEKKAKQKEKKVQLFFPNTSTLISIMHSTKELEPDADQHHRRT